MSWTEIATPPTSIVRVGNGLCTARTSPDQIQRGEAVEDEEEPDRDDHDAQDASPRSIGSDHGLVDRDAADERDERASRRTRASTRQPWFVVSVQAMYVENIAISPCAKLMTPVARWISTSASASDA